MMKIADNKYARILGTILVYIVTFNAIFYILSFTLGWTYSFNVIEGVILPIICAMGTHFLCTTRSMP